MKRFYKFVKTRWFLFGAGLVLGAIAVLGIRLVRYHPDSVHYHANFAVYINGQRQTFTGPQYYEETAATSCSMNKIDAPNDRAHMHDNVNSVVHVEDHLVTWGNFFQYLNWGLGDDYLKTATNMYLPDAQTKLTFMLNGTKVDSIANLVIQDRDKLLISYGASSSAQLTQQYQSIPNSAHQYDVKKDPATCSGSQPVTWADKFKHLF